MDQVSRPFQILLVLTFAFAALWFTALRPKAAEVSPPAAPTAQATGAPKSAIPGGLGTAVDRARAGRAQADASAARRPGAATTSTPAPSPAAPPSPARPRPPARPGAGSLKAPGIVRAALARNQVVVLLFHTPRAADDRAVRAELAKVRRRGGRVKVIASPIGTVSRFGDITAGVQVLQSPTVIVLGRSRQARGFTGFTDATEIDQAVATALRRR